MTKLDLKTLIYGLVAILAIGCGDANVADVEEDADFDEENAGQLDGQNEDEALNDDLEEDEEPLPEPFCGDAFVDEGEDCDDGNDVDGDGCSALCETEPEVLETEGQIDLLVTVDDVNSDDEPAQASCSDPLSMVIEDGTLSFDGVCNLPANFVEVIGSGVVADDGTVEGEINFVLNNRDNVIDFEGVFIDDLLDIDFLGVTAIVGSLQGTWQGTIDADFD
jgi:cysteine-rich repeat protein